MADIVLKSRLHKLGTFRLAARSFCRALALLALTAIVCGSPTKAVVTAGAVWVRLELVENASDGSAFNRCEIEGTLKPRHALNSRIFYGEALAGPAASWEPVRPQSGCGLVASERAANPWTLHGSPYLVVDVKLESAITSENEVGFQASLMFRRLTAFRKDGKPDYEQHVESRTLRVPPGNSAVIPILVASRQETEAFGVRELLLRFRVAGSRPRDRIRRGCGHIRCATGKDLPRRRPRGPHLVRRSLRAQRGTERANGRSSSRILPGVKRG